MRQSPNFSQINKMVRQNPNYLPRNKYKTKFLKNVDEVEDTRTNFAASDILLGAASIGK